MKLLNIFLSLYMMIGVSNMSHAQNKNYIVIDVRTPEEYNAGHVPDSLHIDFYEADFKEQISRLDKNKVYKLYCRSGNRSGQGMKMMKDLGFSSVENLGSLQEAIEALKNTK